MNCTVLKACTKQKSLEQQGKKGVAKKSKESKEKYGNFRKSKNQRTKCYHNFFFHFYSWPQ